MSNSKSDCISQDEETHCGQFYNAELDEDTIVYTDAGKVKELVEQLCFLINDAKAKSSPGCSSLPQAQ